MLDSEKLGAIIAKYLSPKEPDPELEFYYSADYSGISLLMKAEKTADKYVAGLLYSVMVLFISLIVLQFIDIMNWICSFHCERISRGRRLSNFQPFTLC